MAMGNVFSSLADKLGKLFVTEAKFRALDKSDIALLIKNSIETHRNVAYVLGMMSDKEMSDWLRESVIPGLKVITDDARNVYPNYIKSLHGKAVQEERKRPMGSLLEANKSFIKILEEINKNLDALIQDKAITMWNVRMSHLAIMGILKQSDQVANFSSYLFTFLSKVASKLSNDIPKYRSAYLRDNLNAVSKSVCDLLDKKGVYTFMKDVTNLRREQQDVVLGASGNLTGWKNFTNISRFSISFIDALMSALSALNIFSHGLDMWESYKLSKYEKNKETKEWLEAHVALLRMDLANMDKSSPEYTKMLNIIQAYDDKIADYDQKIQAFEEGD